MSKLFHIYKGLLHKRPFVTNVMTTCAFMTTGDLISQTIVQRNQGYDFGQTARFSLAGLIFVGPAVRGFLVAIDKMFGPTIGLRVLGKKLLVDQVCCAPVFLACNISVLTVLKTHSFDQVEAELRKNYTSLLKLNYTFWPFVQVINFYFIPLTYRVLFGSTAALLWNTLFSYRLYNKRKMVKHFEEMFDQSRPGFRRP